MKSAVNVLLMMIGGDKKTKREKKVEHKSFKLFYISHSVSYSYMEHNLRFELVLGRPALLNISEILLKYATFEGVFSSLHVQNK